MANQQTQLTNDERAYLRAKADRLIMLLDASVMPEEVKTSWLTLLPEMNLDQVDRLIKLLEDELAAAIKGAKEQPENDEFIVKLQEAKKRYDKVVAAADEQALAALSRIEKKLPK